MWRSIRERGYEGVDLLDILGFDTVDLGTLAESRLSEPNTPLHASPTWENRRQVSPCRSS